MTRDRGLRIRATLGALLLLFLFGGLAHSANPIRTRRRLAFNPYKNLAAHFTAASSQFASLTNMTSLQVNNTTDFTFAGWAYMDDVAGAYGMLSKGDLGSNSEYSLFYNTGVGWRFRVYSTASSVTVTSSTAVRPANNWDFVAAWHDQAANTINIQVNNGTVDSLSKGAISITASTGTIRLGAGTNGTFFMNGRIDSMAFWKGRILSAGDLTRLYNNGVGMAYRDLDSGLKTSLSTWWDLDGDFVDANGVAVPMTNNNGVSFVAGKR